MNEHLENGPNFIPPLYDVLVKFRCRAVGIIADVEKAFHQIEIRKSDRDKVRFLWVQNPDNNNPSIVQLRFNRLPFWLKPSPSILGVTIRKHLAAYEGEYEGEYEGGKYQEVVKILSYLYVDDLSCRTNNDHEAFEIYPVAKEIIKKVVSIYVSSKATKVYVLLFKCASTRAIHLEIVEKLDVETFLSAFRRFAARRGLPSMVLSDNAKTFKTASKEIRKIIRAKRVQTYFANKGISWRFSVERTPWWGGMWERLVRSVKNCLKKVIGLASFKLDEFQALLVEVECIINSRPITYVYDDTDGVTYPLTPSHLLYGRTVTLQPNDKHFEIVSTNQSLTKRAMYHRKFVR